VCLHESKAFATRGHTRLPEHSVNPCLVAAPETPLCGGPAAQDTERRILLRITDADIGQYGEVDKVAHDSERARDIATLIGVQG
jgi:hypothetical protein